MATSLHVQQLIAKAKQAHAARLEAAAQSAQAQAQATQAAAKRSDQALTSSASASIDTKPESNLITQIVSKQLAALPNNNGIELNKEQADAVERGLRGQSFALIGAAGTGKTTTTQELIKLIQRASHMLPLADSTKHLSKDAPGLVICGYTNKAVNNIRKKLS